MRIDLSDRLIHLSKANSEDSTDPRGDAAANLLGILDEKRLRGGNGKIKGSYKCVCFSEAPVAALTHLLAKGPKGYRYQPYGILLEKQWLFAKGGRPVIYGTDSDWTLLPSALEYRYVKFDLTGPYPIDFTWEREWRILADELVINPNDVTVVVPNREAKKVFHLAGHTDWHYLVLSDLGVPIDTL